MSNLIYKNVLIFILSFFISGIIIADDMTKVISLRGKWKFSIGDDKEWMQENYNDNDWESIYVPSPWEDQGFYGYDGFAWYRKTFVIPAEYADKDIYLYLGYVDDADETYLNGNLIGFSGSMPPNYSTAYNAFRKYFLPKEYLKPGKPNLLSVRVYDAGQAGGIVNGDVGIYADMNPVPFQIQLQGIWKFKPGDNMQYEDPQYNDSKWRFISVPKYWEDQGYPNLHGFAWYRKTFYVSGQFTTDKVVVVLGKIDDFDEAYLNGTYIGPIRRIEEYSNDDDNRCTELRVYYIDGKLLQPNKYNVITVRVYDKGGLGGIYEGPLGIIRQKDFLQYWRMKNKIRGYSVTNDE